MKTQIEATFIGGQFKPDESIPLPEAARVSLTFELLNDHVEAPEAPPDVNKSIAAVAALKEFRKKHPIHGGGKKYSRDELHERR